MGYFYKNTMFFIKTALFFDKDLTGLFTLFVFPDKPGARWAALRRGRSLLADE
jgi:hypothetical protein